MYGISKGAYLHKLIDWFIGREPKLIECLERNSTVVAESEPNSTVYTVSHSQLVEEVLRLIEEMSPEKARQLRETLKKLNSTVSENSELDSTVAENPNTESLEKKAEESSEVQENENSTVLHDLEQNSTVVNVKTRKKWYGSFSLEEHGISACLLPK